MLSITLYLCKNLQHPSYLLVHGSCFPRLESWLSCSHVLFLIMRNFRAVLAIRCSKQLCKVRRFWAKITETPFCLFIKTQKCLFFGESWETHLLLKPVTQPGVIKSFKGPRAAPSLWADQISLLALFPHRCRWNMTWVATLEKTTESWISLAMTCLLS